MRVLLRAFNLEDIRHALELHAKAYALVRWLAGAVDRGELELERMHDTVVSLSHLRPKHVTELDKFRATRLERTLVVDWAREMSCTLSDERVGAIMRDDMLHESRALVTWTRELFKRLEGDYEGTEVLALWRRFAWTRSGAPNKDFVVTAEAIAGAEETLRTSIRSA